MSGGRASSLGRHAAGFIVAPLVVPLVLVGVEIARVRSLLAAGVPPGKVAGLVRDTAGLVLWPIAPLTYATALLVGVPVLLLLARARRLTVPWVVGASIAGGAAVSEAAVLALAACHDGDCTYARLLAPGLGGALSLCVSVAYCAVAGIPLRARCADPGPGVETAPGGAGAR